MGNKNRLGLKELLLGAVLTASPFVLEGCTNYQRGLDQIANRINSSEVSENDKKELTALLKTIDLKNPSKEMKDFMKLPLKEKRKAVYKNYNEEELNYFQTVGVIKDKYNLSQAECIYLENRSIVIARGILFSR